jgi:hypothetical protein
LEPNPRPNISISKAEMGISSRAFPADGATIMLAQDGKTQSTTPDVPDLAAPLLIAAMAFAALAGAAFGALQGFVGS